MPRRWKLLGVGTLLLSGLPAVASATPAGGHLVIVGGGMRTPEILQRIVELAGGPSCRMVVVPMASAEPEATGQANAQEFRDAGCPTVEAVVFDASRAAAPEVLDVFVGATAVFFSGGVQGRLLDAMAGTPALERVREIYAAGGVIAGSSAGAAVMSRRMITGDEKLNPDDPQFDTIRAGNVVTREGFGFVELAIVDQHFVARRRHNRLVSLVLEDPAILGVGIDESTAIVVSGERFEVIGEASVVVYDAAGAHHVQADADGDLAAHAVTMHLLRAGEGFDLRTRAVIER